MRTAKTLIRLGGCPGRSESSLGAQSFCWFCDDAAHVNGDTDFNNKIDMLFTQPRLVTC